MPRDKVRNKSNRRNITLTSKENEMDLAKKLTQGRRIIRIPGTKIIPPPKPPAPLPPLEWAKKNCPKGNHTLGIYYYYDETDLVLCQEERFIRTLQDVILDHNFHPFNCCPYCGRRVDGIIKAVYKQEEKKRDIKVNAAYKQDVKKHKAQVKAAIKEGTST